MVCQWAERFGGSKYDESSNIEIDSTGNVYIAGYFHSDTLNFNSEVSIFKTDSTDSFLAKYNENGICQWAENIGGNNADIIFSIALNNSGNVYIAGCFSSDTITFNNKLSLTINSGHTYGCSYLDGFVAKYNSSGICQWAEKIAGNDFDYIESITLDDKDNLYVAGCFDSPILKFNSGKTITKNGGDCSSSVDGFIAKYNKNGVDVSEEFTQYNISVYPNPATDYLEIDLTRCATLGKCGTSGDIQIFNTLGEIVLSVEQTPPSVQKINISQLAPGIYFIKIGNRVEKFVKI